MKTKILFTIALTVFINLAFAQSNFSDYKGVDKTELFFDGFTDNSNKWTLNEYGDFKSQITSGYLFLDNQSGRGKLISLECNIEEGRNYEIETKIKYVAGKKTSANGILWGQNDVSNFGFFIAETQEYIITKYEGEYKNYIEFTQSDKLETNAYNKLTIRKVDNTYYFFINETLVHSMPVEPFFGKYISFFVASGNTIQIDMLKVVYLPGGNSSKNNIVNNKTDNINKPKVKEKPNEPGKNKPVVNETNTDIVKYDWKDNRKITTLFSDHFDDNSNEWGTGESDNVKREVTNSYYNFENNNSTFYSTWRTIEIDDSRNFEIEASLKMVKSSDDSENCLIWGANDKSSFRFGINKNGEYIIYKMDNGKPALLTNFIASEMVDLYNYNKLTIRKYNNKYYFFLNGVYLQSLPFEQFYGVRFGFLVSPNGIIKIDYFNVSYIE